MSEGLRIDNIDVFYGPVQALHNVSLHVDPGEMVALLGANGAGKSTTLRAISGLVAPRNGTISFDGERIDGLAAHEIVTHGISHVPEGRDLFPTMSVLDNLRAGYWVRRSDASGLAHGIERVFGYFPRLRERSAQAAGTLSGGEQQMLVVARALMSEPKLLVVDELSFGLAPLIVDKLFEILRVVNAAGTSILLVEQFVHMALRHSDRAYVLAKGEVRQEGPSASLADDPSVMAAYLGQIDPATTQPAPNGREVRAAAKRAVRPATR
ncbi:MAG: branched-chain amino acid transport system ATP-binding protein [Frankiaceae bacterium]|jgi:branched-chain amino acid transport system ATP-binding protein|nr:branched-chain amino acid transport system ATP-binding protein [Frankiaceae bacterium]